MNIQLGIGSKKRLVGMGVALLTVSATGSALAGIMNALAQSKYFDWNPGGFLLMHQNPYAPYFAHAVERISENPFLMVQLWACWAWITVVAYATLGLCLFVCLRRSSSVDLERIRLRAAGWRIQAGASPPSQASIVEKWKDSKIVTSRY